MDGQERIQIFSPDQDGEAWEEVVKVDERKGRKQRAESIRSDRAKVCSQAIINKRVTSRRLVDLPVEHGKKGREGVCSGKKIK